MKYTLDKYKALDVSFKDLTSLYELPVGIAQLQCNSNRLVSLPELPDSLRWLMCSNNHITSLPKLNSKLNLINCRANRIVYLPEIPDGLNWLHCDYNPLECLIPSKFLEQQSDYWMKHYYYPYISSYKGQKNILTKYPLQCGELMKQVEICKEIRKEFAHLIDGVELNLL